MAITLYAHNLYSTAILSVGLSFSILTSKPKQTRPIYVLKNCYFNSYDCRRDWRIVQLLSGNCLQLDTMPIFKREGFGPRST